MDAHANGGTSRNPNNVFPRFHCLILKLLIAGAIWQAGVAHAQTKAPSAAAQPPGCVVDDRFFEEEVWSKVAERKCLKCHNAKGDAADSEFILVNPNTFAERSRRVMAQNCAAFRNMAMAKEGSRSRLLAKVAGGLDHGGGEVLKPGSTGYKILERFVNRSSGNRPKGSETVLASVERSKSFFEGATMLPPSRLLRRVTLSLTGRLPTVEERKAVNDKGMAAIDPILDGLFREDAFYERLKEGFNDIFLTIGIEDNAETLLSYDHFEHTRNWPEKHNLDHIPEADRQKKRWALSDVYRQSLLREPLELISYIVRNDRPFTELATADYIMVSPFSARGYGIYEEIKDKFKNPDDSFKAGDPNEYIPARLKALKDRSGNIQKSATGMYPHAGFLSMFHYLRRYPSTETNRNRLRARMFYQHFLGIDVMQLAPRNTDASAVAEKYKIPTMQAPDCVVCHKTIDPVAGIFQDFNFEGHVGPRKDGWYTDMFESGFEGESIPDSEKWRAPQWLAERAVKDPRFPIAMVEHVYYIMLGRKVLQAPEDLDSPTFDARLRAHHAQRRMIEDVATRFKESKYNLKTAFKGIIASDFYRVDGLAPMKLSPERIAELDDIGIVRLLSPEQLERKIKAIFGKPWGRLNDETKVLYGGIDSITVTERNPDPSGVMGALQRILANDVACNNVGRDFHLEASKRILFPKIEPNVIPGSKNSDELIREVLVDLHQRVLGLELKADNPEIDRAFQLFSGIVADAKAKEGIVPRETYFCGGAEDFHVEDPHYTIRAWRGVVTYLLRQHDFLYE